MERTSRPAFKSSYELGSAKGALESPCNCVIKNRHKNESQREWFKRWMCMYHWMQTNYYQAKLEPEKRDYEIEN